jgi:hypothetical protein
MLLKSTDSLQVLLAGAVAANQAAFFAAFVDVDAVTFAATAGDNSSGLTNNTTAVSWVAAPASGKFRKLQYASLYNADTAAITLTVRINDGTNSRILMKAPLNAGDRLEYNDTRGFSITTASGVSSSVGMTNPMTTSGDIVTGGASGVGQRLGVGSTGQRLSVVSGAPVWADDPDVWCIAVSDETTAITAGTAKVTWYVPYACTVLEVFIGVTTQSSSGVVTADVNKAGTSIFSTNPSIDASEDTSLTGTAAVLSTTSLAKGDKMTVDIDAAGTGAKGLKVYMRVRF